MATNLQQRKTTTTTTYSAALHEGVINEKDMLEARAVRRTTSFQRCLELGMEDSRRSAYSDNAENSLLIGCLRSTDMAAPTLLSQARKVLGGPRLQLLL